MILSYNTRLNVQSTTVAVIMLAQVHHASKNTTAISVIHIHQTVVVVPIKVVVVSALVHQPRTQMAVYSSEMINSNNSNSNNSGTIRGTA
jgi:ABC-type antimicrobial peptide transport system ATPase subunit